MLRKWNGNAVVRIQYLRIELTRGRLIKSGYVWNQKQISWMAEGFSINFIKILLDFHFLERHLNVMRKSGPNVKNKSKLQAYIAFSGETSRCRTILMSLPIYPVWFRNKGIIKFIFAIFGFIEYPMHIAIKNALFYVRKPVNLPNLFVSQRGKFVSVSKILPHIVASGGEGNAGTFPSK